MHPIKRQSSRMIIIKKSVIHAVWMVNRYLPVKKDQPKEMLPIMDKPATPSHLKGSVSYQLFSAFEEIECDPIISLPERSTSRTLLCYTT
ncbi:protein of unknown function [Paenibacillus alvei]|uniref:Uncharacterized protein n=1 Tax=Paenibacillus alvei TaxID=44250 RepID=A0A383RJS0_PAEAL|nr:protein of unknown function [Paenibacillus alvei]